MATLMAVHAHPDDEATSTGGVLAKYADEGITTVLVTCTNGEFGDLPGGIKPQDPGHDTDLVVKTRLDELDRSCKILDVSRLELLGYHDSGMPDWEYRHSPEAFCNIPVDDVADRIADLLERYRPDVVVTYDERGGYDHPDHIHASRATMAAVERSGIPQKVYLTAMRRSRFRRIREILQEQGVEVPARPEPSPERKRRAEEQEARITTFVDVGPYVERKLRALRTHASQVGESFWSQLPDEALGEVFREETFIRELDTTGTQTPEDDLFAGLR